MVTCMTEPPEADGPHLEDADGNRIEIDDEVNRAWRESLKTGTSEPHEWAPPDYMWWHLSRPDGGGMHVKVTNDHFHRWVITDVYVHGQGLTATDLQAVPLTQLDLAMNLLGYWEHDSARAGDLMDGDVIADSINELAAKAGYSVAVTYQVPDAGDPDDLTLLDLRQRAASAPPELPRLPSAERPRLTRPDGTDPDGFAARVAAAYREYATQTRAPAVEIAKEAGVPIATVRSWIREARRRGKLPEGRKGKAG